MRGKWFVALWICAMFMLVGTACGRGEPTDVTADVETIHEESHLTENEEETPANSDKPDESEPEESPIIGENVLCVHEADIDHDGEKEYLTVEDLEETDESGHKILRFRVTDDGQVRVDHMISPGWRRYHTEAFFLYAEGGKDYLIRYHRNDYGDSKYWSFLQYFHGENYGEETERRESLEVSWLSHYTQAHFPIDSEPAQEFLDVVNPILENSTLIWADGTDGLIYEKEGSDWEQENLGILFGKDEAYSGCKTLEEKFEVLNQKLLEKWFVDGKIPEMPETFKELMSELVWEKRPAMIGGEAAFDRTRKEWFEAYNGEKLQFIEADTFGAGLSGYPGILYYRADEGETPEQVAKRLVEEMMQRVAEISQSKKQPIKEYQIGDQTLYDWQFLVDDLTTGCWEAYLSEFRQVEAHLESFAREWVERYIGDQSSFIPLEEDMWRFYANGTYRLEEEMIPLSGGIDGGTEFLLMKYGDVYRVQNTGYWGLDFFAEEEFPAIYEEAKTLWIEGAKISGIREVHKADIDHDGTDETIIVSNQDGSANRTVSVWEEGRTIWWKESFPMKNCAGLFLYKENGEDYLVAYDVGVGNARRYLKFYLEPSETDLWRRNEILCDYEIVTINTAEGHVASIDIPSVCEFTDKINRVFSQSRMLCWSSKTKPLSGSMAAQGIYREDFEDLFLPVEKYEDCDTLAEKLERFYELKMEVWYPDGQVPESLKNLESTLPDRLSAYIGEPEEIYVQIDTNREKWFEDYNGDKLQFIEEMIGERRTQILYYRADEGETPSSVAEYLAAHIFPVPVQIR